MRKSLALFSFLVLLFGISGCDKHRTCTAPKGIALSDFDEHGRLLWTPDLVGGDGSTTLFICDAGTPRAVRVKGLQLGSEEDNQAKFAVDNVRHIATESRLITASTKSQKLGVLDLTAQCVVVWSGGCDEEAPKSSPTPPVAAPATPATHGETIPVAAGTATTGV